MAKSKIEQEKTQRQPRQLREHTYEITGNDMMPVRFKATGRHAAREYAEKIVNLAGEVQINEITQRRKPVEFEEIRTHVETLVFESIIVARVKGDDEHASEA